MKTSLYLILGQLAPPLRLSAFVAACGLVLWVSNYQPSNLGESVVLPFLFQIGHAPLYGILALTCLMLWGEQGPFNSSAIGAAIALVAFVGYLDEWHQLSVPARASDLRDVCTDLIGACSAVLLARWASATRPSWGAGLKLLVSILAVLAAWGWYSFDATPWPLPFVTP
jgi:VanZ family protein